MVYGYESSLPNSDSFQNLEDLGTSLHSNLRALLFDGSFKPIVFIAHSLGGLIVKQFLISLSKSKDDVDQRLRRAVYGIAFFGVPHDSMDIHSLIPIVGDGPNRSLLESIGSTNSQILSIQQREFSDALGHQGETEIVSFYETCLSPTALRDERDRWTMSGEPAVLVSKASATHCRHGENGPENICAINRTHSEMIKFSQEDPEYDQVLGRIKSLARRAIITRGKLIPPHLSPEEQKCLHSLAFKQMQDRDNDIEHAVQGTCEWLLKHETYIKWATSNRSLLWIKGKPGAGKFTLLKYALGKQRDMLGAGGNDLVLSFFFHARGDDLQKTPLGFLRSLLHQVLKQAPEALSDLVSVYQQKCRDMGDPPDKWQWHLAELWGFFKSSLPRILTARSIWLFIDALDECGEIYAKELVRRFTRLLEKLPPHPAQIHFHICFTCRHYPILSSQDLFEICLEKENKIDIATYVQSELKLSSFDKPTASVIRNLIIVRASGVFLWARLVTQQARDLELNGAGSNKIKKTIRSIPKKELRWALVIDARFFSLQECQKSENYIPDNQRMNQLLIKLSRGLVEVTPGPETEVVQFIYQSVKDFFTNEGLVALDDTSSSVDESIRMAHFELLKTCIYYLKMVEICHLERVFSSGHEVYSAFPFLDYASGSLIFYLRDGDSMLIAEGAILELLAWPSDSATYTGMHVIDRYYHRPSVKTTLSHIIATCGIIRMLTTILKHGYQTDMLINAKYENGETRLLRAAKEGQETAVRLLLGAGAQVDLVDRDNLTPLSWAAGNGHEGVVRLLLAAGAQVDAKCAMGRTPLLYAARKRRKAVAKLLLDAGADNMGL
ncbi:nacht and ankyrin domain-containing protein [Trichoderma pleuroticola]